MHGVKTPFEERIFQENYLRFQGKGADEADNFSSIGWGAFATFWNDIILEEEEDCRPKTDMTIKTAYYLQGYFKKLKKSFNVTVTMLGINTANKPI